MRKQGWLRGLIAIVALTMTGCAWTRSEIGGALPPKDPLVIGTTTKSEVLTLLGPPRLIRRQFDGELFIYRYVESERLSITVLPVFFTLFFYSDGELKRDDLTLMFDRDGVLRSIGERIETADS